MLGQAAGPVRSHAEEPFFRDLAVRLDLPFAIEYLRLEESGVSAEETLRAVAAGRVQLAAVQVAALGADYPGLLGLDLVGLATGWRETARATAAYAHELDKRLQAERGVKLFGAWPNGPELLYCAVPLADLADVRQRRVAVDQDNLSHVVAWLGGRPYSMPATAMRAALAEGAADCAIGDPVKANALGWPEVASHLLPLPFRFGIGAYAMNLPAWLALPEPQRQRLGAAFQVLISDLWSYSRRIAESSIACGLAGGPCAPGRYFSLIELPVTPADTDLLHRALRDVSFARWAASCDGSDPGCSAVWKAALGRMAGIE